MKLRRQVKQNPHKRKLMNDFFRFAGNRTAEEVSNLSGIDVTTIHKMNRGTVLNPKEKTCELMRKFIREHQNPEQVLASGVDNTLSDFLKATSGMTVTTISRLTGISETGVQKIVSGTTANPRRHTLDRMEKFLRGEGAPVTKPEPKLFKVPRQLVKPIPVESVNKIESCYMELCKLVELINDALTDPNIDEFDRALLVHSRATIMVDKSYELAKGAANA